MLSYDLAAFYTNLIYFSKTGIIMVRVQIVVVVVVVGFVQHPVCWLLFVLGEPLALEKATFRLQEQVGCQLQQHTWLPNKTKQTVTLLNKGIDVIPSVCPEILSSL